MQLEPCPCCRRHVVVGEETCPFCGATSVTPPSRPLLAGRLSRAAVFAGAALAGTACWSSSTKANATDHQQQQVKVENKAGPVAAGTITGVVRNGATGAPLAGWLIHLQGDDGEHRTASSDANGVFTFANLPPGAYTLRDEPNHPRQGPNEQRVELSADAGTRADFTVYLPEPDRGPCCKPYGAPPARRRIV